MKYFANYDENGRLLSLQRGNRGGVAITAEEYNRLIAWILRINDLAYQVFNGEITMADVPEEDKAEVLIRVEEMQEHANTEQTEEISADEAIHIILEGETL